MEKYDLFVIGAGSGGVRAARMAAIAGARVCLAERQYLGGTCVNVGCVPKKLMVYASSYAQDFHDAKGFGWDVAKPAFNWSGLIANKNTEIARLNTAYDSLIKSANVDLVWGTAQLLSPNSAKIGDREIAFDKCLIATGGKPVRPDVPGQELGVVSDDLFYLDDLPKEIIIIGGGFISVEFSCIFNALGSKVTLLNRSEQILRGFDDDVRGFLANEMAQKGVNIHTNTPLQSLQKAGDKIVVRTHSDHSFSGDLVVFATGRSPNSTGMNCEELGIASKPNGQIITNDRFQTSIDNIFALGDVASKVHLTPIAIAEAMAFTDQQFGNGTTPTIDYHMIASAVFSQPSVGSVGYTQQDAAREFGELDIFEADFRPMRNNLSGSDERSYMKLIVARKNGRVVGLHMVGPDAGEIVQGFAVAMQMGATKADFDRTLAIHPTAAEEFVTMRTKRA